MGGQHRSEIPAAESDVALTLDSDDAVGRADADQEPILSPVEKVARYLRDDLHEGARIADLGASSAGINLNLSDEERSKFLEELVPAIENLGFSYSESLA